MVCLKKADKNDAIYTELKFSFDKIKDKIAEFWPIDDLKKGAQFIINYEDTENVFQLMIGSPGQPTWNDYLTWPAFIVMI